MARRLLIWRVMYCVLEVVHKASTVKKNRLFSTLFATKTSKRSGRLFSLWRYDPRLL